VLGVRLLLALVWPDGRNRYYAYINQCWTDAQNGNMPVHETGARLKYVANDGSREWEELRARARREGPVFSRGVTGGCAAGVLPAGSVAPPRPRRAVSLPAQSAGRSMETPEEGEV